MVMTNNTYSQWSRRQCLTRFGGGLIVAGFPSSLSTAAPSAVAPFKTRGVVLVPEDLSWPEWPQRAKHAGLTTIALHHGVSPSAVVKLVESDRGQRFLQECQRLGLQVEYELHALRELLPRELLSQDKSLFRMNDHGERVADANLCVHSARALDIIGENALRLAKSLRPTTGRYFFWGDDGQPWCRCPECRDLSDSDQALLLENHLAKALSRDNPNAQIAHLAYANTIHPPQQIKPHPAVFLEFAPINRRYDIPYSQQSTAVDKDGLPNLKANLGIFPPATAQVLEYWLDVSRVSSWKRPAIRLPWHKEAFLRDLETYRTLGIRHITSFAAWIDQDYVQRYGDPGFLSEYGAGLTR